MSNNPIESTAESKGMTRREAIKFFLVGGGTLAAALGTWAWLDWYTSEPTMHESGARASADEQEAIAIGRNGLITLANDRWGLNPEILKGRTLWGIDSGSTFLTEPTTGYEPNRPILSRTFLGSNGKIYTLFSPQCFQMSGSERAIGTDFLPHLMAYEITHAIGLSGHEVLLGRDLKDMQDHSIAPYSVKGLDIVFANREGDNFLPILRKELTAALGAAVSFDSAEGPVPLNSIAPKLHYLRQFLSDANIKHGTDLSRLGKALVNSDIEDAIWNICGIRDPNIIIEQDLITIKDYLITIVVGALIDAGNSQNTDRYNIAFSEFSYACRLVRDYIDTSDARKLNDEIFINSLSKYQLLITTS